MSIKEFNKEYRNCGGIQKLNEMRALRRPQKEIANQFNVTAGSIPLWMEQFFGSAYDPRYDRRNVIIQSMMDLLKHLGREEFDVAFKSDEYYQRALDGNLYDSE